MSVVVSRTGKVEAYFIDKGIKTDGCYYHETLLQNPLLPDLKSNNEFVFEQDQDSAPSHWTKLTAEFLQQNILDFIECSVWPPSSPDLNVIDCAVQISIDSLLLSVPMCGKVISSGRQSSQTDVLAAC